MPPERDELELEDDPLEGEESSSKEPPKAPEPDPLEVERARNRTLEEEVARMRRQHDEYLRAQLANLHRPATPPPPPTSDEPDKEESPEAWAEWRAKQIARQIAQEEVAKMGPVAQQLAAQGQAAMKSAQVAVELHMRNAYGEMWDEYGKEVKEYLAQFPPQYSADVAAVEEALYRIKGRHDIAALKEKQSREGAALVTGGRAHPSSSDEIRSEKKPLDPRAVRVAQREKMNRKDWDVFGQKDDRGVVVMDVDTFREHKARKAQGAK